MNERLHVHGTTAANDRLDARDSEGGTPAGAPGGPAAAAVAESMTQRLLLERLGAALLEEWHALPTPLRRSIYVRAIANAEPHGDPATSRESLARLLHAHMAMRE